MYEQSLLEQAESARHIIAEVLKNRSVNEHRIDVSHMTPEAKVDMLLMLRLGHNRAGHRRQLTLAGMDDSFEPFPDKSVRFE